MANKLGLDLGIPGRNLMELRFADDVVILARQRSDVQKMLQDLAATSAKFGLRINFSKTKILTQNVWAKGGATVQVSGREVAVLDDAESEKYLGRKLCFDEVHQTELQHRLALGWASFHKHKAELCSPAYRLEDRVRLFDAVVTPVELYGASTWVLLKDMGRQFLTV